MNQLLDYLTAEFYLAGQQVPAGLYREIDTGREIRLEEEACLPASLDGYVTAYVCVQYTWKRKEDRRGSSGPA